MRKGQLEHLFSDAIPGIIILFIALVLLGWFKPTFQLSPTFYLPFQDSFERQFFTFLQSPVQQLHLEDDPPAFLIENNYTYGDLLVLSTLATDDSVLYQEVFAKALRQAMSISMVGHPSLVVHAKHFFWRVVFTRGDGTTFTVYNAAVVGTLPSPSLRSSLSYTLPSQEVPLQATFLLDVYP